MDPERPKNKISHNQTKLDPLHRDRRVDYDHICFFLKMHIVCRRYHD
jgi:hypothetical protein